MARVVERDERRRRRRRSRRSRSPPTTCPATGAAQACAVRSAVRRSTRTSAAQTAMSTTVNASSRPWSSISRSRRTKPSPSPIQAAPSTVAPTAAVVGARVLDDGIQHEGEEERGEEAAEHPHDAALLRAEERERDADIDRGRERTQRSRRRHELVHCDPRGDGQEREQPPAAEPDMPSTSGRPTAATRILETKLLIVRRIYGAGSRTPRSRCAARPRPKSGQRVSVNTYSAYADCQRRKFEMRQLAGRADHEVGIGHLRLVEARGKGGLVDVVRVGAALERAGARRRRARRGRRSRRRSRVGVATCPPSRSRARPSSSAASRARGRGGRRSGSGRPARRGRRARGRWSRRRSPSAPRPRRRRGSSSRSRTRRRRATRCRGRSRASTTGRRARDPARWPSATGTPCSRRPAPVAVHDDRDRARDLGKVLLGADVGAGARDRGH